MQRGDEPKIDDIIMEIATLLAAAYRRRSRIRLVPIPPSAVPSTEGLANAGEQSVHELTLTSKRKGATQP